MIKPCETIANSISGFFECKSMRDLVRVRTPFLLPDGSAIDLYVEDDGSWVTDMGETMQWLNLQTASSKRTTRQMKMAGSICETLGVKHENGSIKSRIDGDLCDSILKTAQACMRVSDISLTFSGRSILAMVDEVAEYLTENDFHHTRNKQVVGRSRQKLYVDFEVHHGPAEQHSLAFLKVLSTTSRALTGRMVDHSLRTWLDLRSVHHGTKFVTVLDDTTGNIWDDGEVQLLEEYSTVTSWSNRAELLEAISL